MVIRTELGFHQRFYVSCWPQCCSSPSEVFELIFTPSLTDTIIEQTNLYTKQVIGDEKYADWAEVTADELEAYLGICILIEINRLPALDDYWSSDRTLRYSPIADMISRDRFREIFSPSSFHRQ